MHKLIPSSLSFTYIRMYTFATTNTQPRKEIHSYTITDYISLPLWYVMGMVIRYCCGDCQTLQDISCYAEIRIWAVWFVQEVTRNARDVMHDSTHIWTWINPYLLLNCGAAHFSRTFLITSHRAISNSFKSQPHVITTRHIIINIWINNGHFLIKSMYFSLLSLMLLGLILQ